MSRPLKYKNKKEKKDARRRQTRAENGKATLSTMLLDIIYSKKDKSKLPLSEVNARKLLLRIDYMRKDEVGLIADIIDQGVRFNLKGLREKLKTIRKKERRMKKLNENEVVETTALTKSMIRYIISLGLAIEFPGDVVHEHLKEVFNELREEHKNNNLLFRVSTTIVMHYSYPSDDGELIYTEGYHSTPGKNITDGNLTEFITYLSDEAKRASEEWEKSSYTFLGFGDFTTRISPLRPIYAGGVAPSTKLPCLPTPKFIASKKCAVNVECTDGRCIEYCLLLEDHFEEITKAGKRASRPSSFKKEWFDEIRRPKGIIYPIQLYKHVPEYERLNNIKINVLGYNEKDGIHTMYSSMVKSKKTITLIYISDESSQNEHFLWVHNTSRLFRTNAQKNALHYCMNCLNARYPTREKLEEHEEVCLKNQATKVILPKENSDGTKPIHKFENHFKIIRHPFALFTDFESTLKKYKDVKKNPKCNTDKFQHHQPNSYGLKFNCIHEQHSKPISTFSHHDEEELIRNFVEDVESYAQHAYDISRSRYTCSEKRDKPEDGKCELCSCDTEAKDLRGLFDTITGEFKNWVCQKCMKSHWKNKNFLPVYAHNLKGYDSHLFIRGLAQYGYKEETGSTISCIPNNEQKYITFSKKIKVDENRIIEMDKDGNRNEVIKPVYFEIRFLDSNAFFTSSLDKVVSNLTAGCNGDISKLRKVLKSTSDSFPDDDQFQLMIRKGVYPYEWMDNYYKLFATALPKRREFFSTLVSEGISNSEYAHAQNVWDTFKCKTFKDYHNLYLKADVLLLADAWENFRESIYEMFGIDCVYSYTTPGLGWEAYLKKSGVELELLTDVDKVMFYEKSIRGGVSLITKRFAGISLEELKKPPLERNEALLYLDATNLYGWAMIQHLPYGGFEWDDDLSKYTEEYIRSLKDDGDEGYTLEVDLDYPKELHDLHNDYPLCPEKVIPKNSMLNNWQIRYDANGNEIHEKTPKLCPNLQKKEKYVIHYRALKLVLQLGLKLTKVHRVMKFKQSDHMKEYIMGNTKLRAQTKDAFKRNLYKLLNNAIFGKSVENTRARINFELATTRPSEFKLRQMKDFTIFSENLVGIHKYKSSVKLDKPIYVGSSILDLSKVLMQDFHYNVVQPGIHKMDGSAELLFTDTDSLCYHIKGCNPYEFMHKNKSYFDMSTFFKKEDIYYDEENKGVLGKMKVDKDEVIKEFVGLRPKCYSLKFEGGKESHTCKSVNKSGRISISHQAYKDTLLTLQSFPITQNSIRSYNHDVYTIRQGKIGLSAYDNKRFICNDYIHTVSFGHYKLSQN